jgi:hypothetical protein
MAASDYIQCKRCECKLIYDGDNEISDSLEKRYGDPKAWCIHRCYYVQIASRVRRTSSRRF